MAGGFSGEVDHGSFIAESEEGTGVAERDGAIGEQSSDSGGELEQSEEVGDGGAVFSDDFADLGMGEGEFVDESFVSFGFLQRVEVTPLQVFDECEGEERFIVDGADDGADFGPAQ